MVLLSGELDKVHFFRLILGQSLSFQKRGLNNIACFSNKCGSRFNENITVDENRSISYKNLKCFSF